jgi:hypothetical protein
MSEPTDFKIGWLVFRVSRPIFEIGWLGIFQVQVGRPISESVGNFENLLFLPLF